MHVTVSIYIIIISRWMMKACQSSSDGGRKLGMGLPSICWLKVHSMYIICSSCFISASRRRSSNSSSNFLLFNSLSSARSSAAFSNSAICRTNSESSLRPCIPFLAAEYKCLSYRTQARLHKCTYLAFQ